VARHNREGEGVDQRGFTYRISYARLAPPREGEPGPPDGPALHHDPLPEPPGAAEAAAGDQVRTRITCPEQGVDVEVVVRCGCGASGGSRSVAAVAGLEAGSFVSRMPRAHAEVRGTPGSGGAGLRPHSGLAPPPTIPSSPPPDGPHDRTLLAPFTSPRAGCPDFTLAVGRWGGLVLDAARALRWVGIWAPSRSGRWPGSGWTRCPSRSSSRCSPGIVLALQASYTFTGPFPCTSSGSWWARP
jgi:hypothetical protein